MTHHAKNLLFVVALLLTVVVAGAAVDPFKTNRQALWASDPTSMAAEQGVNRGNVVTVGSSSASQNIFFAFPPGGRTVDNTHVYNCADGKCQYVDLYTLLSLGNIQISQLAGCAPGYTLIGSGTSLYCTQFSALIPASIITYNDEVTIFPNSAQFILQDGDPSSKLVIYNTGQASWSISAPIGTASNNYMSGVGRTITATAPIRIDGGSSADLSAGRTISITPASSSSPGTESSAHFTKVEGLQQQLWYSSPAGPPYDFQYRYPATITNGQGIDLVSSGSSVMIQTNFPIPAGPVPQWYGDDASYHRPSYVANGRGIELLYNPISDSITIQTNFAVPSDLRVTEDSNGYRRFERTVDGQTLMALGSAVSLFSVTESAYGANGTIYSSDYPDVTAMVELEITTEGFKSPNFVPVRQVWVAEISKFNYNQQWQLTHDFVLQTNLTYGASFTSASTYVPSATASITSGGTLTVTATYPPVSLGSLKVPSASWKARVFGGGRYQH